MPFGLQSRWPTDMRHLRSSWLCSPGVFRVSNRRTQSARPRLRRCSYTFKKTGTSRNGPRSAHRCGACSVCQVIASDSLDWSVQEMPERILAQVSSPGSFCLPRVLPPNQSCVRAPPKGAKAAGQSTPSCFTFPSLSLTSACLLSEWPVMPPAVCAHCPHSRNAPKGGGSTVKPA